MEIAIGCRFEFELAHPTHGVLWSSPTLTSRSWVGREALTSTPELDSGPYLDSSRTAVGV